MRTIHQLEEDGTTNRAVFLARWRQYREDALLAKLEPSPGVIPIKEYPMHQDARISSRLAWLAIIPLCILTAAIASAWLLLAAMHDPKGKRAWELAEGFDRLANAAIGGESEMTLSAHAGRDIHRPWAMTLCWLLNKVDPEHCEKSWQEYQKCPRS